MSDSTGALNIALVGPYTSGKTTLLESMLFVAGAIGRKGKVTDGNTVGDWSDEARGRQSSVEVNAASFEYRDRRFTILDCPGSIEFFAETANALMGVDLAIIVCTPDLNRVWTMGRLFKFLAQHEIPHVLFANRMDETAVRVAELIEAVQPVSDRPFVPCQVAIRDGDNVNGYVDLITGKAYVVPRPGGRRRRRRARDGLGAPGGRAHAASRKPGGLRRYAPGEAAGGRDPRARRDSGLPARRARGCGRGARHDGLCRARLGRAPPA